MGGEAAESGLRFLAEGAHARSIDAAVSAFHETIAAFGFDACAAGAWGGIGRSRAFRFYFNSWPQAWLDLYNAEGFFHDDPMVMETRRRMVPFSWGQLSGARSFSRDGARVVEAGRRFGWHEVLGVPMHGPFGYEGLVSLGALKPVSLSVTENALLRAVATAIHDRCHAASGVGNGARETPQLTAREIECMQWVAAGKTDTAIAATLGISATTAHFHIEQVKKKLGVRTRTEAVALMVLDGFI